MRMELNIEQRKHLAVTLRTLSFGVLVPIALKIYDKEFPFWFVIIWVMGAMYGEWIALKILGGISDD